MGRIRSARRQPSELVRRAAQRVLLLGEALDALEAGEPADATLRVDGDPEFAPRIVAMYRAWARERGMRLEDVTEERPAAATAGRPRSPASARCGSCARRPGCTSSRSRTAAAATTAAACA